MEINWPWIQLWSWKISNHQSTEPLQKPLNWYSTNEKFHLPYLEMKVPQLMQGLYTTQARPSDVCWILCSAEVPASAQRGLGLTPTGEDNHLRATHSPERKKKKVTGGFLWEEERQEISIFLFSANGALLHRRGCSKALKVVPQRPLCFNSWAPLNSLRALGLPPFSSCLLLEKGKACPQNLKYLLPVTKIRVLWACR